MTFKRLHVCGPARLLVTYKRLGRVICVCIYIITLPFHIGPYVKYIAARGSPFLSSLNSIGSFQRV